MTAKIAIRVYINYFHLADAYLHLQFARIMGQLTVDKVERTSFSVDETISLRHTCWARPWIP